MRLPSSAPAQWPLKSSKSSPKRPASNTTSVIGFSLLSFVRTSYNAFFFVTLKPWGERKSRAEQYQAYQASLNGAFSRLPAAFVFSFSPPAIPGVGTSGGFTFILEDRSGSDVRFWPKIWPLSSMPHKRPEIAGLSTTFLPSVPQKFVQVDRDKVLKQGVALTDVYKTIQAFMGGYFINYFNRFGRQWQVYIEAEGEDRATAENVGEFDVRNKQGRMSLCPRSQRSSQTSALSDSDALQRVSLRPNQW